MKLLNLIAATAIAASLSAPAFAADSMKSDSMSSDSTKTMMMKPGETIILKPDGTMAKMMTTDATKSAAIMKNGTVVDKCHIVMMGNDGKVYALDDMKMDDGTMACDAMMTTAPK